MYYASISVGSIVLWLLLDVLSHGYCWRYFAMVTVRYCARNGVGGVVPVLVLSNESRIIYVCQDTCCKNIKKSYKAASIANK